jgi:hypothetical protein
MSAPTTEPRPTTAKNSLVESVQQVWDALAVAPSTETFSEAMIADLPEPVQRYFRHAIAPNTPLASSVELTMTGSFKMGNNWVPMRATERLSVEGFAWKAAIGQGVMKFFGWDYYYQGSGQTHFALWNVLTVANDSRPDTARSAIGRLAGELLWLPSALLPQRGVTWEAMADDTIQATFAIDGEPISMTLTLDSNGRVLKVSYLRWGDQTPDRSHTYLPFGGDMLAEQTFGGFTIPTESHIGWWYGSDRYAEFFRGAIEQANFR